MRELGRRTGDGDERLRVGAVKLFVDGRGAFTGPAAYTREPYKGQGDYRGKLTASESELRSVVEQAHAAGWQLGVHAIGDAAIELAVAWIAGALDASPRPDARHYLNHFTMKPPRETLRLMARHGIAVSQQPNFTYTLEGRYVANLDGERLETNNPLRSVLDADLHLAISSDILPIGPIVGLYAATTRRGASGRVFAPEERLDLEEALRAATVGGAWLTREEDLKGTLEVGKLADLVVLSEDLRQIAPERLLEVEVDQTWLGGRLVYDRLATPAAASGSL